MHRLRSVYNFIVLPFPGYAGVCKRRHLPLDLHQMCCSALISYPTPPASPPRRLPGCGHEKTQEGSQRLSVFSEPSCATYCVGIAGFEPTTPRSQSECATKLRHIPSNMCEGHFTGKGMNLQNESPAPTPPYPLVAGYMVALATRRLAHLATSDCVTSQGRRWASNLEILCCRHLWRLRGAVPRFRRASPPAAG